MIYSTWRSVELAGYCDFSLDRGRAVPVGKAGRFKDDGVEDASDWSTEGLR